MAPTGTPSAPPPGAGGLLAPDGPVARALAARSQPFEARPEQRDMAAAVERALSSGRHLLVEAGTGVGKSFAYLLPALAWAAAHDKVVAVATSTIALQEQLVRRDLPLLAEALPFPVRFALVKGRGNYLCTRRLHLALGQGPMLIEDEARAQLAAVEAWSREGGDGTRQGLPFHPLEGVWDAVKAESGNCLGRACRFYARCAYQASRQRAAEAHLLVLNHHVLLADLALQRSGASFLPRVDAVIVDEAHDLEEVAAEHLGLRATSLGLAQALGRLWSPRQRAGLLARHPDPGVRLAVDEAREAAQGWFRDLAACLGREPRAASEVPARGEGGGWAAAAAAAVPADAPAPQRLGEVLRRTAALLEARRDALDDADLALEVGARARALAEAGEALEVLAAPPRDGEVRWIDRTPRGLALCAAPVDVGPLLREVLWSRVGTAVLTSATLSTGRPASFAFVRRRLGLAEADELALGSPFDYASQARIVLRADLPDPSQRPADWEEALPEAIEAAVRESGGGALVLFTATAVLRRTAARLRERLADLGLEVLVQGEGLERPALLERFRASGGVLLGVASFWQGVDVPGDALRHVVIVRLPFEVPTHPLGAARRERIERSGGDAFLDLTLPQTALRLKQGFGRLIRSASDRGQVTILDPRVVTKRYGRVLLDSLPPCPVEVRRGAPPPDPAAGDAGEAAWSAEDPFDPPPPGAP